MEPAAPKTMTARTLERRIRRFNGFCVLHGCVLSGFAVAFWCLTVYFIIVSITIARFGWNILAQWPEPWLYFDPVCWGLVATALAGIVWIGFFHGELFFSVRVDPDLRAVRGVTELHWLPPSWWSFLLSVLCFAPILTRLAAAAFDERISINSQRLQLAVTIYHYLDDWGDWVPYPSFESQRQAVILLSRLGLARVSRRFGKHQVKLVGGVPRWKRRTNAGHAERRTAFDG